MAQPSAFGVRSGRRRRVRSVVVGGVALVLAQTLATSLATSGAAAVDPSSTVPATASTASGPSPTRGEILRPNLVVLEAKDIYVQRSGSERRLRFESGLGNRGVGPIEVRPNRARPCPEGKHHATQVMYLDKDGNRRFDRATDTDVSRKSAGCMVFHRFHDHWHFEAASRYTLFRADRPDITKVAQRKMSFCLRDSKPLPERYDTRRGPNNYGACSKYSPQGISVGWVDVYQSSLAGQAIRLKPTMRDGVYCLHIRVDPLDMLEESNEDDNTSVRTFSLQGDRVAYEADNSRCRELTR